MRTEGHEIEASSDASPRSCDGTNAGRNPAPGPTPTAATVDAMALAGLDFDGRWFAGIDDYLISRWGGEAEAEGQSWSLYSNDSLSNLGGCQLELREGAEVLWKLGFATAKPLLMLAPRGTAAGAPPLIAEARPGAPFAVEVLAYHPSGESEPPAEPSRDGATAYAGAKVAPVQTSAGGAQTVLEGDASTVTTNAEGVAEVTFATPGWHRLKAVASGAVRSNRLDVCVAEAGEACGAAPADDAVRSPPSQAPALERPGAPAAPATSEGSTAEPPGRVAGAAASNVLSIDGVALTPLDDRAREVRLAGRWLRRRERGAFADTVSMGARGARLSVRLAAGRPVFVLRDVAKGTRILEVVAGKRREVRVRPVSGDRSLLLRCASRARAGTVRLRVLTGRLGVDGVGLLP